MRIAVVQEPPVFLDRSRTIINAVTAIREAAANEAQLVVFPEAYIPGYPAWIWRLRPGADMALAEQLHARLLANAVSLDGDDLTPVCEAAKEHTITVVCGIDERDAEFSRGTVYNTVVVIGPDGSILNRHRKLMPLARCALYALGVEIYLAPTYDSGGQWIGTLQHIAREGGCWVVGSAMAFRSSDIPESMPGKAELYPDADDWINPGDSVVIAPGGKIAAGPMRRELGILYAAIDLDLVGIARRSLDVVGHYARPDIFQLHVNTNALKPVVFEHPNDPPGGC